MGQRYSNCGNNMTIMVGLSVLELLSKHWSCLRDLLSTPASFRISSQCAQLLKAVAKWLITSTVSGFIIFKIYDLVKRRNSLEFGTAS